MAETLGEQGPRLDLAGPEGWLLETIVGVLGDGITVQEGLGAARVRERARQRKRSGSPTRASCSRPHRQRSAPATS